jgi:hypothetical protein
MQTDARWWTGCLRLQLAGEKTSLGLGQFDGCRALCVVIRNMVDPAADRVAMSSAMLEFCSMQRRGTRFGWLQIQA